MKIIFLIDYVVLKKLIQFTTQKANKFTMYYTSE
jgi:hypothetical protein